MKRMNLQQKDILRYLKKSVEQFKPKSSEENYDCFSDIIKFQEKLYRLLIIGIWGIALIILLIILNLK